MEWIARIINIATHPLILYPALAVFVWWLIKNRHKFK